MFGQGFIIGKLVEDTFVYFGSSKEDAKSIGKVVSWGVTIVTLDATSAVLESAAAGAMIEAGLY